MRVLSLALLLMTTSAFADQAIHCTFANGEFTLDGKLNSRRKLTVSEISGASIINGPDREDSINNNPVPRTVAQDGRTKYAIDALGGEGEYGNVYALYLPASPKKGENGASLSYTYVSRGEGKPTYVQGTCQID